MQEYKDIIQKLTLYLEKEIFSNTEMLHKNKQAFVRAIHQSVQNFCYQNIAYKKFAQDKILIKFLINEHLGLGVIDDLLAQKDISEIMINGSETVYVEKNGKVLETNAFFSSEKTLNSIVTKIANSVHRRIDNSNPMVNARLADGSRFNAIVHPLALNGTTVTIRKFLDQSVAMKDLIDYQTLCPKSAYLLSLCVLHKQNTLIAGGTGSGKTTLLNILSSFIPENERIISIEDAAELRLKQKHVVRLETREENVEKQGKISIRELLINALRMRPDRIIVGECRSEEVIDMLQAMNTGHDGSMTTIHANNARDALKRIENLILMSGLDYPTHAIREQIASSIDIVIFIKRLANGKRVVSHISEITHIESGTLCLQELFHHTHEGLAWSKQYPSFVHKLPKTTQENIFKTMENC